MTVNKKGLSVYMRNKSIHALLLGCFISLPVMCEEGGSGHYMPGSMSSFMDAVPATPSFIARLNILNYQGKYSHSLPFSGIDAAGVKVDSQALGLTMVYRPHFDIGKNWSYAFGGTIPYVNMRVSAEVQTPDSTTTEQRTETASGLGDIMIMPLMLNQMISSSFNVNYRVSIYAPTGEYEVSKLANVGKNFWTIEPTIAGVYLGKESGIEASFFAGIDFNSENKVTQYKSGSQGHIEGTLAQHFPLWKGLAGIGATGFYYHQLTGDSGEGATYGDFKAQSLGAGPVISYVHNVGKTELLAELKWLHEFETKRRVKGDTIFLKAMAKF